MRRTIKNKSVERLFYGGNHEEVLEQTIDAPDQLPTVQDLVFIVGALTFVGRIEEAEGRLEKFRTEIDDATFCACGFFIGIGLCRKSEYDRALKYLIYNFRLVRNSQNRLVQFYAYQGAGFYRYFCGRYANALRAGRRAFRAALTAEFNYGKFLASDLIGHALIQTGKISAGLKTLTDSLRYSKTSSAGETDEGVRITLACYQAQFGRSPETDLQTLQLLYEELSPQDSYSRASLLLEIARQLTLRGKIKSSQDILNQACRLIYSSAHRRQGVMLNLRYAYNLMLIGEAAQALNLVRASSKELDPRVDKALELQILGMEYRLRKLLGVSAPGGCIEEKILKLTRYTGSGISRKMQNRPRFDKRLHIAPGEDPLGELIDITHFHSQTEDHNDFFSKVFKSGYLVLLVGKLPIEPHESVLYFDLLPDTLLIVDRSEWRFEAKGISPTIKALVRELSKGETSKQKLIERVWGYEYDRLRHDSLIYPAISRLRQTLGPCAAWIEATEQGYSLQRGLRVIFHQPKKNVSELLPPNEITETAAAPEELSRGLNYRQLSVFKHFKRHRFMDVQKYKNIFKVSQITASRDLSHLHRLSMIEKTGRGRATRYFISRPNFLNSREVP